MREALGNAVGHFISIAAALDFMQWLLMVGIAFFASILFYCQFANDTFDLRYSICTKADDRVVEGETLSGEWKPDLAKIIALGTWLSATWIIIALTEAGKLTENYFGLWALLGMMPKAIEAWIARK